MEPSAATSSIPRLRRRVWVPILIGISLVLGAVLAVQLLLPRWLLGEVQRQASARGVSLLGCKLEYQREGLTQVRRIELSNCRVEVLRPFSARGSLTEVRIQLTNNLPTELAISGADLAVSGDVDWSNAKQQFEAMGKETFAIVGERNRIAWHSEPRMPATIVLNDVQKRAGSDPWTAQLTVLDLLEGTASLGDEATVRLHWRNQPQNHGVVTIDRQGRRAEVRAQLEKLPVATLKGLLFHNVPRDLLGTSADARIEFTAPLGLDPTEPSGRFDLTLHGLNYPVPRELEGLVHDRAPQVSGKIVSNRAYTRFEVPNLSFETGVLQMKGHALIEREDLRTQWKVKLQGPLNCAAIVASAAKVHLNSELAKVARQISSKALRGSVNVFVAIEADSNDLAAARVANTVGIGCGLKPMPFEDLLSAPQDLLRTFPELAERLFPRGKATQLPKLQLPQLEDLPKLQLPKFGPGNTEPQKRKLGEEPVKQDDTP